MSELKPLPCPFCGAENLSISNKTTTINWVRKRHVAVYCKCCNTYGPRIIAEETSYPEFCATEAKEQAIAAWNRRAQPANEPLTLEELRGMDGEPLKHWAWIEVLPAYEHPTNYHIESAYYRAHSDCTKGKAFCCGYPGLGFHFKYQDYGKTWLAYRRPPERSDSNA